jgi:hypothetical protein
VNLKILKTTAARNFAIVFVLLLLIHYSSLAAPPYWDTILGSFHQAIWLKNNDFNQWELCRSMPSYTMGGPKVYTNSIYPMIQAVMMACIPNITVFLVLNHVVQLLLAALSIVVLHALFKSILNPRNAVLATGVWASFPMFHSMSATINMDLPVCFLTLLGVLMYLRKQYAAMLVAIVAAVLVKQSAAVAIIAISFLSLIRVSNRTELKYLLLLIFPLALSFSHVFIAWFIEPKELTVTEQTMKVSDWIFNPGAILERLWTLVWLVPDLTVLLVISFLASIIVGIVFLIRLGMRFSAKLKNQSTDIRGFIDQQEIPLLCSAIIVGFTLLYFSLGIILPRYAIWVFPYVIILIALLLKKFPRVFAVVSVIWICMNVANHSGALYRLVSPEPLHGFAMYLERSMEFQNDLVCNQKMAIEAEKNLKDFDVVTCWPFTHMLAAPEFGYLKTPLSVVSANGPGLPALNVPHASTWLQNRGPTPRPVVFISTISNFFMPLQFNPQIHNLAGRIEYEGRFINVFQEK